MRRIQAPADLPPLSRITMQWDSSSSDNETLVQMQPVYRCVQGGPLLAKFGNATDGCPQQFPNVTSIKGDGRLGSHGGSGLSGFGGTIRLGELLPGAPPIPHAIKIELQHQWYYGMSKLQPATAENGNRTQYVWPATGSDSGTEKAPGGLYGGTDPNIVARCPSCDSFEYCRIDYDDNSHRRQAQASSC